MKIKITNKEMVLNYLRTQYVMGITTADNKGNMWPATVYYIVDDDLNLYFMSNPKTLHAQNIKLNPKIACTIADSDQKMPDTKIGIQLFGTCKRVNGLTHVKNLAVAYKKSKLKVGSITLEAFKKAATSGIYVVSPKKIKFFNTKLFPKDNFIELEL